MGEPKSEEVFRNLARIREMATRLAEQTAEELDAEYETTTVAVFVLAAKIALRSAGHDEKEQTRILGVLNESIILTDEVARDVLIKSQN